MGDQVRIGVAHCCANTTKLNMRFYVYHLIDPRTGTVFYVGKGTRNRSSEHVRQAKRGEQSRKCDQIRSILAAGAVVQESIVMRFEHEAHAYAYEVSEIARIGLENLTNCNPGGFGGGASLGPIIMSGDPVPLRFLYRLFVVTDGLLKKPVFMFGGKWHDVPMVLIHNIIENAREVIQRRGEKWTAQHLPAHCWEIIQYQVECNAVR